MTKFFYQHLAKPLLFNFDAETVHTHMTHFGETLGKNALTKAVFAKMYGQRHPSLTRTIAGITFPSPIGLSAGFDYEARLTQILPSLGFGFQTIGTITNLPYEGNPRPILGRLPDKKSLLVNKGFKNLGADATINRLKGLSFAIPVGISIGKTNHRDINTQDLAIADILQAFKKFEHAALPISYYELNISCPNIFGPVTFYPPTYLAQLLQAVDSLALTKPLFIKLPITESDSDLLRMVKVITNHSPQGIIIGNLAKDPSFKGGLSGKPTFVRSNELISLVHHHFPKLLIIGCGGIFSLEDAQTKLACGATLLQLITGMIYEGPQLISDLNTGLITHENNHSNRH